jgi:ribosomal protein S3
MGQRVNPSLIRTKQAFCERPASLSFTYPKLNARYIAENAIIREMADTMLQKHLIAKVIIERIGKKALFIKIQTDRSNQLAGENEQNMQKFRAAVVRKLSDKYTTIEVGLLGVDNADTNASCICNRIVEAIELTNGTRYNPVIKEILAKVSTNGPLLGISIRVKGRSKSNSIASAQKFRAGRVQMQTVSADIVKHVGAAKTTTGMVGVTVVVSRVPKDRTHDVLEQSIDREKPRTPYAGKPRTANGFSRFSSKPSGFHNNNNSKHRPAFKQANRPTMQAVAINKEDAKNV